MMYANKPQPTNLEPQLVNVTKEINLGYDCDLTLSKLKKYGVTDNSTFSIIFDDRDNNYKLYIHSKRLETKKEIDTRVKRDIAYKKGYEEFILKYPRK